MKFDLHNNIVASRAISPVAIGTTGTGKTSGVLDTAGYNGVEFVASYGTITSTTAVYTAILKECSTTGGTFTSVADSDLLGTEAAFVPAVGTRVSGSNKNCVKKLGYIGKERYLKIQVYSAATAGTIIGVDMLLHSPRNAPTS